MDYLIVQGVPPWDGRYDFDLDGQPLTVREWGFIKRHTGYLPLTIEPGFEGGDPELWAIWAVIAIRRAGKIQNDEVADTVERFLEGPGGAITFEGGAVADGDASPPAERTDSNGNSPGLDSSTSSTSPVPIPRASGTPASATSGSVPATLGS